MLSAEELFIYDIDRIREILRNPTVAGVIDSSGILRRLLTEGHPLIHQVRKPDGYRLRFVVADDDAGTFHEIVKTTLPDAPLSFLSSPHGIDPTAPMARSRSVGLDEFLQIPVEIVQDETLSVRTLINYVANVAGGVHRGNPKSPEHKAFDPLANNVNILGQPAGLHTLHTILKITFDGMEELYSILRA